MSTLQLLCRKLLLLLLLFLLSSICISQVKEEWEKRYSGPGNSYDYASSMVVDAKGNVYVTGGSIGVGFVSDYATIKYDAAGNELWVRRYSNGNAKSIVVDVSGNVYVTGWSYGGESTNWDYTTIKYDPNGKELWVKRYNGTGNSYDFATSLAIDVSGNVYVTGESYGGESTSYDYTTIKYDPNGKELWVKRYNGFTNHDDYANSLVVDVSGNVYVTGGSYGGESTNWDYTTIKYDPNGKELWVKRYNGTGNDFDYASSIAVDANGNVYVMGTSSGITSFEDYTTIKYDKNGNQLWVKRYNGPGNLYDYAQSLALDGKGNVYITGISSDIDNTPYDDTDFATIKYDALGNQLWVRRYNGPGNENDESRFLAIDANGNVYVSGWSGNIFSVGDFATIKYDAAGNTLWVKRHEKGTVFSMAVDAKGNVYVTGHSYANETIHRDYLTIKYSQTTVATTLSSFTLINAQKDEMFWNLKEGDTINLAALSSFNLNIRANTNPYPVGSVRFELSGPQSRIHTESTAPYALFSDNKGDYYSWTPPVGNYTLTATPYTLASGGGIKGTPLTIHFTVLYQQVKSFTLINANTDSDIAEFKEIKEGSVIDLSTLPTQNLNIRANTNPYPVGSVRFELSGPQSRIHTESTAPYALFSDNKGDYYPWTPPVGNYTLTATPYAAAKGGGQKGMTINIHFSVKKSAANRLVLVNDEKNQNIQVFKSGAVIDQLSSSLPAGASTIKKKKVDEDKTVSLWVAPNPFRDKTTLSFTLPRSGYTSVEVYDMKGALVHRLFEGRAEEGKVYRLVFQSKALPVGMYTARVVSNGTVHSTQLLMIK